MSVYIIAEAGVNHNGSLERALKMIDVAAEAGADAVKFQTFKSESVISRYAAKAQYQVRNTGVEESQLEMVKKLELSFDAHRDLVRHCKSRGIEFLSTPFDVDSLNFLAHDLGIRSLKIASGEITNYQLLVQAGRTGLPAILSTGMSTLGEVEAALGVLAFAYLDSESQPTRERFLQSFASSDGQAVLGEKVTLLHCTTEYPAPFDSVNLRAMDTLALAFGLDVGLSDHTVGISVATAAAARFAKVIEKHFTLDRLLPGPDHKASLEPDELKALVASVRQVEAALGSPMKIPCGAEYANIAIARKSLVANQKIHAGEPFTSANLGLKRPGTGISASEYWNFLGRNASRDYELDEMIEVKDAGC
jgi:N-acetylneuraminate synthase